METKLNVSRPMLQQALDYVRRVGTTEAKHSNHYLTAQRHCTCGTCFCCEVKEKAFERAQWFVNEWAKNGVEATARVFYRDGSPVADFSATVHQGHAQILNHIEV